MERTSRNPIQKGAEGRRGKGNGMGKASTLDWTAPAHPRRVLIFWNSLFFVAIALLSAGLQTLIIFNLVALQRNNCPANAFIASLTGWGSAIAYSPWALVSIVAAALAVPALFRRLPWSAARHVGGGRMIPGQKRTSLRIRLGLLAVVLILALPPTLYKAASGVCVWPQGFSYRDSSFDAPDTYSWAEVHTLSAVCIPSRSGYRMDVSVETANGKVVNLALSRSPDELTRQYAQLADALTGIDYAYETEHMDYCPRDIRAVLRAPPRK